MQNISVINYHAPRIGISIVLGLFLRLLLILTIRIGTGNFLTVYSYDSLEYITPGREWLQNGHFTYQGLPDIFRTPGYPLFLLPGIRLGHVEIVTVLLQIALSTLAIYILYKIVQKINIPEGPARWAAFIYACEPITILYSSKLLSDTLFTFVILLFFLVLLHYFHDRKLFWIILSAVLLSGAVYVRPAGYFLPIFLTIIIFILDRLIYKRDLTVRTPLKHLFLFIAVSMGLIGLWHWRNYTQTGYAGFSTADGINLYFFDGAAVEAARLKMPLRELQDQMGYRNQNIYWQVHPEQKSWTEAQINKYQTGQGIQMILSDLPRFSLIYAIGMGKTLFDPSGNEYLRLFNAYSIPSGIIGVVIDTGIPQIVQTLLDIFNAYPAIFWTNFSLVLIIIMFYLFALIGLLQRDLWRNKFGVIFLLIGFYLILVTGGAIGTARFRVPLIPVICMLAGIGIGKITESYRNLRKKPSTLSR